MGVQQLKDCGRGGLGKEVKVGNLKDSVGLKSCYFNSICIKNNSQTWAGDSSKGSKRKGAVGF